MWSFFQRGNCDLPAHAAAQIRFAHALVLLLEARFYGKVKGIALHGLEPRCVSRLASAFLDTYMASMGILLFIAIPLLAIAIAWPLIWWQRTTVASFVNRWIAENDLELMEFRERSFPGFSRFTFFNLGKQHLVFVDVKNKAGERRQCWLKLGGLISGLSSYQVECKWIEQR